MLENLDLALAELVGKIETLSPKLWGIAMKEVYVDLFANSIGFFISILLLIIGVSCWIILSKKCKRERTEKDYKVSDEVFLTFLIGAVLGCLVGIILFFTFGYEIGAILINPEYRALEIIMELVK